MLWKFLNPIIFTVSSVSYDSSSVYHWNIGFGLWLTNLLNMQLVFLTSSALVLLKSTISSGLDELNNPLRLL